MCWEGLHREGAYLKLWLRREGLFRERGFNREGSLTALLRSVSGH